MSEQSGQTRAAVPAKGLQLKQRLLIAAPLAFFLCLPLATTLAVAIEGLTPIVVREEMSIFIVAWLIAPLVFFMLVRETTQLNVILKRCGWMAACCAVLLGMSPVIFRHSRSYDDMGAFMFVFAVGSFALSYGVRFWAKNRFALPIAFAPSRKCPYCAETIKLDAAICRFCNRDVAETKSQSASVGV